MGLLEFKRSRLALMISVTGERLNISFLQHPQVLRYWWLFYTAIGYRKILASLSLVPIRPRLGLSMDGRSAQ